MYSVNRALFSSPSTATFTSSSARFKTCRTVSWGPGWGGAISLGQRTHVRITNSKPFGYKENKHLSPISDSLIHLVRSTQFSPSEEHLAEKTLKAFWSGNTSSVHQAQMPSNKLHAFWLSCGLMHHSLIMVTQSAKRCLCDYLVSYHVSLCFQRDGYITWILVCGNSLTIYSESLRWEMSIILHCGSTSVSTHLSQIFIMHLL